MRGSSSCAGRCRTEFGGQFGSARATWPHACCLSQGRGSLPRKAHDGPSCRRPGGVTAGERALSWTPPSAKRAFPRLPWQRIGERFGSLGNHQAAAKVEQGPQAALRVQGVELDGQIDNAGHPCASMGIGRQAVDHQVARPRAVQRPNDGLDASNFHGGRCISSWLRQDRGSAVVLIEIVVVEPLDVVGRDGGNTDAMVDHEVAESFSVDQDNFAFDAGGVVLRFL